ncbi:MAG: DoxX family protein [Verrucomicrobia bacterium]|nr:DoxX family protein [Verrucomicrobiota bacterium]MCH8514177.1 DoxX family protein [Kiritimatiellia bacterium]
MKIAVIIVRVLMGLLFLFASAVYFLDLAPTPELEGDMKAFNEGLAAARYLMPLVKTVELLAALALLSGFFLPLAVVVLFPVSVNIFLVHLFLAPEGLPVAIFVLLGNLFLAYACRHHYRGLWGAKRQQPTNWRKDLDGSV